jgi:hypothetical protein
MIFLIYTIGLFLEQDLSAREACERGCAAIENDGLAHELEDLCFWLCAAQVARAETPFVVSRPITPVATSLLSSHRHQLLLLDLPALSSTSVGQGAQLIAGAVGNLMDQQRQSHEADTTRRVIMPDTLLGSSIQILLRLSQVDSSTDPFWHDVANEPKQRAVDEAMAICVPGGNRTHIVTPSLTKKIMTLEFRKTSTEDLSTGIQPFILVQTTATKRQHAQAFVHVYDTVMGGPTASYRRRCPVRGHQ